MMTRRSILALALVVLVAPGTTAQPPADLDALVAQVHQSGCREGLEALDLGLDLTKKIGPQIDRLIEGIEQELAEAEESVAEIDTAVRGDSAA